MRNLQGKRTAKFMTLKEIKKKNRNLGKMWRIRRLRRGIEAKCRDVLYSVVFGYEHECMTSAKDAGAT